MCVAARECRARVAGCVPVWVRASARARRGGERAPRVWARVWARARPPPGARSAPQPRTSPWASGLLRLSALGAPPPLGYDSGLAVPPRLSLLSRQWRCRAPSASSGPGRAERQGGRGGPELGLAGREGAAARGRGRAARAAAERPRRLPGAPRAVLPRSGQPRHSCPDAGRWLAGGSGPGGAGGRGAWSRAGERRARRRAPRPSRATSSPPPAARGQTRPRAEEPRGREGRRKEVASPGQGILNYRLKASKTVHIFHVSADGRDKRKHRTLRGKMAPSRLPPPLLSVQM